MNRLGYVDGIDVTGIATINIEYGLRSGIISHSVENSDGVTVIACVQMDQAEIGFNLHHVASSACLDCRRAINGAVDRQVVYARTKIEIQCLDRNKINHPVRQHVETAEPRIRQTAALLRRCRDIVENQRIRASAGIDAQYLLNTRKGLDSVAHCDGVGAGSTQHAGIA